MPSQTRKRSNSWLVSAGRTLLRRLETPRKSYEKRIVNNMDNLYKGLIDETVKNPYGSALIMRHYSQIVPRDFDLSPNFEIIKYNIIGMGHFDYQSIWVRNEGHANSPGRG